MQIHSNVNQHVLSPIKSSWYIMRVSKVYQALPISFPGNHVLKEAFTPCQHPSCSSQICKVLDKTQNCSPPQNIWEPGEKEMPISL